MSFLVCNVGWMQRYQGITTVDQIRGGGSYVSEHGMGHEICNFLPDQGRVFGYVQQPGAMNLERLGAPKGATQLAGVTVIWTAKRPKGPTVVIGWYEDATVYRHYQTHATERTERSAHGIKQYNVQALWDKARLLPDDERTIEVPRGAGGMGQSLVWYPDTAIGELFLAKIRALITGKRLTHPTSRPRQQDQMRKVAIEQAAISLVTKYYEERGYVVDSVEKDNKGWDLVARSGKTEWRVEVKGLSGPTAQIELTPNEYGAWSACAPDYRLAIVTDALQSPELTLCGYDSELRCMTTNREGETIAVEERIGARIRVA